MKLLLFFFFIFGTPTVFAKNQRLILAGEVPLQADVRLVANGKSGNLQIASKSSPQLKTEILKRGPASIVRVTAP